MPKNKWELTGDACPKCKGKIEHLCSKGADGTEYQDAERCPVCKWQASYTDTVILAPGYLEIHREED